MRTLGILLLVVSLFGSIEANNYIYKNQPELFGGESGGIGMSIIQTPEKPPVPFEFDCFIDDNPLNGFVDDWGYCVPGLPTNESWFMKQPQYTYGTAVFYAPGIMESTARFREMNLDNYVGGVALLSPGDIGETVWLRRQGHEWEGPFLSVDCGRRADIYTEVALVQEVVEVDFDTALRWGLTKYTSNSWETLKHKEQTVEVWIGKEKPLEDIHDDQSPIYFAEWWLERVEFMEDSIDPSPYYYPNGENPEWDIRDGQGRRCFTLACQE